MSHTVFGLGYDVRAVRNPASETARLLLRQADHDLYSVDDLMWPSLWTTCLHDAAHPEFLGPTQNLWTELSVLRRYVASGIVGRACEPAVFVAVDVFVPADEPEKRMGFWRQRNEDVEPMPEENRTLLGYDVADWYLGSWLHYSDDPPAAWHAAFGEREDVVRTGLLADEASAQALAHVLQERNTTDWYVYRLWRTGQP